MKKKSVNRIPGPLELYKPPRPVGTILYTGPIREEAKKGKEGEVIGRYKYEIIRHEMLPFEDGKERPVEVIVSRGLVPLEEGEEAGKDDSRILDI